MAGVNLAASGGGGGRRSLDAELNTIPMIDLMMVTISFLLITAVWSNMSRLDATAKAPADSGDPPPTCEPNCDRRTLQIDMNVDRFLLTWKDGDHELSHESIARRDVVAQEGDTRVVRFPELGEKLRATWRTASIHRAPSDRALDHAVLHVDDAASYAEIVGAMDAVASVKKANERSAFEVAFAAR